MSLIILLLNVGARGRLAMSSEDWTVPILTDDEYKVIIKNSNYDVLLLPIKKENRKYLKYRRQLGNLSKKSKLVQLYLPSCVLELYKSRDPYYVKVLEQNIRRFQESLIPDMETASGEELTIQKIKKYSASELAEILKKHKNSGVGNVDLDLFQVQLKMNGISLSNEDKAEINKMLNGPTDDGSIEQKVDSIAEHINSGSEYSNQEHDTVPEKGKSKKAKKLTAEEKAEKNRLALERKKAEQIDSKKDEKSNAEADKIDESNKSIVDENTKMLKMAENIEEERTMTTSREEKHNSRSSYDEKHVFVGYIDIRGYTPEFYNFQPIGLLENGKFVFKKKSELEELLPDSAFGNINLRYEFSTDANYIADLLHQDQLMILEVSLKDLKDNFTPNGERNKTGYYIPCKQAILHHQLRHLYDDGLYRALTPSFTLDDIATKKIAYISKDSDFELVNGEKILLRMDKIVLGPLEVKVSQQVSDKYIINPNISEHQYVAIGYKNEDILKETIEEDPEREYGTPIYEVYYRIKEGSVSEKVDVIPDSVLMDSLKNFMQANSLSEIPDARALSNSDLNVLKGKYVTDEILSRRVSRIDSLLKDQDKVREYSSQIANALYEIISDDKDSDQTTDIINILLSSHPEITDQIQASRRGKELIKEQKRELEDLKAQKESLLQETAEQKKAAQNKEIDKEIEVKQKQLAELNEKLSLGENYQELEQRISKLNEEVKYQENHKTHLREDTKGLESTFTNVINNYSSRIAGITLDGYISNKMLEASVKWESEEDHEKYLKIIEQEKKVPKVSLSPDDLTDYFVRVIQRVRPNYDRNLIINILICTTQGFLTILSGEPGNGKTSLCNILGKSLGLMKNEPTRYIQVSVERGWTSKRDFVGYYNPLTKSFEENNHAVYDGLELLDAESRNHINRYPFMMLLDEANLSPMEYYWADFMNVSDDRMDNHSINLGADHILEIPETLHFIATINNDHTTEALSPRLIDRAFVITLPKVKAINYSNYDISEVVQPIEWEDLSRAFSAPLGENLMFNGEIQRVYEEVLNHLRKQNIQVSARTDIAIHRYWKAAADRMEIDKNNNDPGIIALDYAVAQKLLPKIQGSGEEFRGWLEDFEEVCQKNNLLISLRIIDDILDRGKNNMNYYQFFG